MKKFIKPPRNPKYDCDYSNNGLIDIDDVRSIYVEDKHIIIFLFKNISEYNAQWIFNGDNKISDCEEVYNMLEEMLGVDITYQEIN